MSYEDFCLCTPSEFSAIYENWRAAYDRRERDGWEQTRALCVCMLQPYSKKRLRGRDIMLLPWDREAKEKEEVLSDEERAARYEAAKKRYGIG